MKFSLEKLARFLFALFVMVLSVFVLTQTVPENKYIQQTIEHLDESQNTVMTFSGTTIATSLAISALPDDFASPLANTVSDLNTYFIFMFAVIFVEKLIVVEGTGIALTLIIPAACLLYMIYVLSDKELFRSFSSKLLILGISLIVVIPVSTHFTEHVCADYLVYVDETIAEADAGAAKINDVMAEGSEDASLFDKLSEAFKSAIRDVTDLLTYFRNVVKRCVNSVAIMLVTTFVIPLLIMLLFRWLLTELFAIHLPAPNIQIRLPHKKHDRHDENRKLLTKEDES